MSLSVVLYLGCVLSTKWDFFWLQLMEFHFTQLVQMLFELLRVHVHLEKILSVV